MGALNASIVILGVGYGVHGAVEVSSVADLFQGPHLGAILGALEFGWGIGGFLGRGGVLVRRVEQLSWGCLCRDHRGQRGGLRRPLARRSSARQY